MICATCGGQRAPGIDLSRSLPFCTRPDHHARECAKTLDTPPQVEYAGPILNPEHEEAHTTMTAEQTTTYRHTPSGHEYTVKGFERVTENDGSIWFKHQGGVANSGRERNISVDRVLAVASDGRVFNEFVSGYDPDARALPQHAVAVIVTSTEPIGFEAASAIAIAAKDAVPGSVGTFVSTDNASASA